MTMQNVAWPMITVARPSVMPSADVNVAFSAMPVTMPGSVIGSTTRKLTTSRPKNRYRCTANAAMVPSTNAIAVAPRPTTTELASDFHIPSLCHAVTHHCVVNPVGGKANVREELNALTSTRAKGT